MKGSNALMDWIVKLIFFLMLLPFFVSLVLHVLGIIGQMILVSLLAVLPWLIGIAILIGVVAGGSAGLVMRRRLPPRNRDDLPPPGAPPVRRPRGPGFDEEE
jgi:hypothetical protein